KMSGVAARAGHTRTRTGPAEPALRNASGRYDHLAGEMGVPMLDTLAASSVLAGKDEAWRVTRRGEDFLSRLDIDFDALSKERRHLCKSCLDWSMRRAHLSGSLGAALLDRFFALHWARRDRQTRVVHFTPEGARKFHRLFPA